MFAGQGDVEYVCIKQATGEYAIIPESEVSVCQGADEETIVLYAGTQDHTQELEIGDDHQEAGEDQAIAYDIVYIEDGGGDSHTAELDIEHEEESGIVQMQEDVDGANEVFEDVGTDETEDVHDSAGDTRFVMVSEQEVLVVKKTSGSNRTAPAEHSSNSGAAYGRNRIRPPLQNSLDYENRPTANVEARLMKSRRRAPPQSQKKGPKLIQDFLLPHLDNGTFGNRLVWVDRAAGTFAMSWSHKNGAEWRVDDCIVFREWDRLKKRDVVESHPQYWMESKQRFRAALAKVSIPCHIDNEEFKSSKVFQIKWTRETRPDILDNVGARPRYFELPPRGSMGKQDSLVSQEELPEGFFVESYREEEVVASGERYSPNATDMQEGNEDAETVQQAVVEQEFLDAAVSSVTEQHHSEMKAEQQQIHYIQHIDERMQMSEEYCTSEMEISGSHEMLHSHDAAAQEAAAAVLSSRFFTEKKHGWRAKRRPLRKEALKPIEKILRRCKQPPTRVYTICPLCRFFSANYALLLRHLMVHREERPFTCLHCTQSFKLPELLVNHLREHHRFGSPNVCFLSNLEATSSGALRRAELRLVQKNLRTCAVCAEHCYTEYNLTTHVEELHGTDALTQVVQAAIKSRRRSRIRMRRKFINLYLSKPKVSRRETDNSGSARTGGGRPRKLKKIKLLCNEEHQTSLVVCDGEVLIEETPVDWGEQILEVGKD